MWDYYERTGEHCILTIPCAGRSICIEKIGSIRDTSNSVRSGGIYPMHKGASNRVLLAFLPPHEQQRYMDGLSMHGSARQALEAKLEEIAAVSYTHLAIRPDNGVKAVCHDIKGDADDNNIEIIDGIGEIVLCGTKSRQNHIPKQDKQHHQHRTADQQQGDRVAHTAVGALGIMLALANTQKSCTAVTNHQGYCQRDDRDGKDHIGCTVAQISYCLLYTSRCV